MSYVTVTLNHFRALQAWAAEHRADVRMDVRTFMVEITRGGGRCVLRPQFFGSVNGRMMYTQVLGPDVTGFIGWLPYRPIRWPLSSDKLEFKRFVQAHGLRTPTICSDMQPPQLDHVWKCAAGSFGQAVYGPYRAGTTGTDLQQRSGDPERSMFAEEFIVGRNLKAWFWGGVPFHLHLHPYASILGDGASTIAELIRRRTGRLGSEFADDADAPWIAASLAYQGWKLDDIAPVEREVWIDYRYGRSYQRFSLQTQSDSALSQLSAEAAEQVLEIGLLLHADLTKSLRLPVLFAVDGVLDSQDRIWWLETNSNPVLPPTGYPLVLATLFESDAQPSTSAARKDLAAA